MFTGLWQIQCILLYLPFLQCPPRMANATLGTYWLAVEEAGGAKAAEGPKRCECSIFCIVCDRGGGQYLPLSVSGPILQCFKGHMEGIALYLEEPLKSLTKEKA